MRIRYLLIVSILLLSSCATVGEKQFSYVQNLTAGADSLSNTPSALFGELASVRKERGVLYAASVYSVDGRVAELGNVAEQYIDDTVYVRRVSVATDILSSYIRALKSLTSKSRYSDIGTEIRGIGRNIDRSVEAFNSMPDMGVEIPDLHAGPVSGIVSVFSESYMKCRQKKFLKEFVIASDTLVWQCCEAVSALLKSGEVDSLIAHEKAMLAADFASYLNRCERIGHEPSVEMYARYVDLCIRLDRLVYMRRRAVTAFTTLRNAHRKLAVSLAAGGAGEDEIAESIYDDTLKLLEYASEI